MTKSKSAREVFEAWGQDERAEHMAESHWPRVRQAFAQIPDSRGDYLEIGVGSGYGLRHMATHQFAQGRCHGLDISPSMVARAGAATADLGNVTVEEGDFLAWRPAAGKATGSGAFNLIFSMEVFYYFADPQAAIDRAFALLAPGGRLWVLVNYYLENEVSHGWPELLDTPMALWSAADYRRAFEKAGFEEVAQQSFADTAASDEGSTLATLGVKPVG